METRQRRRRLQSTVSSRAVALWSARSYDQVLDSLMDMSGNGLHARLGSTVGPDTNDPLRLQYRGQKTVYFPGSAANYLSRTALTAIGTGNFSLSAKISVATLATQHAIIAGATAAPSFRVEVSTGKVYIAKVGTGNGTVSTGALSILTEYVIGYSRSGTTGTYYINGVAAGTTTDNFDYTVGITEIGSVAAGTAANANGTLFWARIYSAALDATAMAADATGVRQANCVSEFLASSTAEPYATVADGISGTWTLNRSASGRKLAVVDRDMFLLGTDDYFEVANHPLLNFAPRDSLTLVTVLRRYGTLASEVFAAKRANGAGSDVGYNLRSSGGTPANTLFLVADGSTEAFVSATTLPVSGRVTLLAGIRSSGLRIAVPGTEVTASDTTNGALSNTEALRFGRYSGAGTAYADYEFLGGGIFRESLNADDLRRLAAEFNALIAP